MLKNKKGFTLIELLATIVILGIIMIVAVPNVTGIIYRNRSNTYVEDAKKMVTLADYAIRGNNNKIVKPATDHCIVFSLQYLDNAEFEEPPNGGKYQKMKSFVLVKKEGTKLVYYAQIVEEFKSTYRGVSFTTSSSLNQEGASNNLVGNFKTSVMSSEIPIPASANSLTTNEKDAILKYVQKFKASFTCDVDAAYVE